ncbi:MAG: DUF302 domain-containing protein [Trueperaceae bacterium]|nr:DUF302 domain-containing protein [Trueperaceae bacterium]
MIALALAAGTSSLAVAQEVDTGMTTIASSYDFARTTANLEQVIADEGLNLVTTFDHAASAEAAGLDLLPTTVFVFGNPHAGTPLMQAARTIALDLPQKMLVWEDEVGDVFVTWREPATFAADHGLAADHGALPNISALLEALARTAAGSE